MSQMKRGASKSEMKAMSNRDVLTMDQLMHQDDWVCDSERFRCHVCTRNFTQFRRKHHCRMCGEVVCSNCTLKKLADLPVKGRTEVKVCMSCILSHANQQENPQQPPAASTTDRKASNDSSRYTREKNSEFANRMHSPPENSIGERTQYTRDVIQAEYDYPLDFSWGYPWPKPPVVPHEQERLEVLRSFDILDTPAEDVFDIICDLASNALKCPIAVVSLIDEDRQWFKASVGLAQNEIPRNVSFCAHTIISKEPMVVLDTLQDKRFEKNPLVTGAANIRFYAGAPICTPTGHIIGTVFVFDNEARTTCDLATLEKLSNVAMKNLEDRKNAVATPVLNGSSSGNFQEVSSHSSAVIPVASSNIPNSSNGGGANSQELVVQNAVGDGQVVAGPKMETMLMDLLCRTTETQQQLATQQGAMFQTLGQHTAQIDKLADAVARMEAKLDAREAE